MVRYVGMDIGTCIQTHILPYRHELLDGVRVQTAKLGFVDHFLEEALGTPLLFVTFVIIVIIIILSILQYQIMVHCPVVTHITSHHITSRTISAADLSLPVRTSRLAESS